MSEDSKILENGALLYNTSDYKLLTGGDEGRTTLRGEEFSVILTDEEEEVLADLRK